jgi:hypothetical protein
MKSHILVCANEIRVTKTINAETERNFEVISDELKLVRIFTCEIYGPCNCITINVYFIRFGINSKASEEKYALRTVSKLPLFLQFQL